MRWHFFQDQTGAWRWEQELNGETVASASRGFPDKPCCIADAKRHGFGGGERNPGIDWKTGNRVTPD